MKGGHGSWFLAWYVRFKMSSWLRRRMWFQNISNIFQYTLSLLGPAIWLTFLPVGVRRPFFTTYQHTSKLNIYFQSPAESEAKFCRLPDMATMTLWHIHGKTSCSLRAVSRSQWQPDDRPLDKQGRTYKNIIVLRLVSNQFQLASSGWLPAVLKQKFRLEDREISAEYIHTYW